MQMTTYREGEAMSSKVTPAQWLYRHDADLMECVEDPGTAIAEMEQWAREVSEDLCLPIAKSGRFAPIVFEVAYARYCRA